MGSGEFSAALREMLRFMGSDVTSVAAVSSHSLKATPLSWLSKFGTKKAARKILGYHVVSKDATMDAYSRDLIAAPLRELEDVMYQIRTGRFRPDATRSGMIAKKQRVEESEPPMSRHSSIPSSPGPGSLRSWRSDEPTGEMWNDARDQGPLETDVYNWDAELVAPMGPPSPVASGESEDSLECTSGQSDSSSADEDTAGEREAEGAARAAGSVAVAPPELLVGQCLFQHRKLGTLHRRKEGVMTSLACGRLVNSNHKLLRQLPSFNWPFCSQCWPG
jgi:hypothetical protein